MDGLRLCSKYSYMPNHLGFCGPPNLNNILLDFALGQDAEDIRGILTKFEALHPYLKLIASSNGIKDEFDLEVVEALWIGNKLLNNVTTKSLREMMRGEFKVYLPPKVLDYFCCSLPDGCLPHHSLHVLHLQTITGVINRTTENQDKCRVSWGEVKEKNNKLVVESQKLTVDDGCYTLQPCIKVVDYTIHDRVFTAVAVGDTVAIHWNLAVEKLNNTRLNHLMEYTNISLKLLKPLPLHH